MYNGKFFDRSQVLMCWGNPARYIEGSQQRDVNNGEQMGKQLRGGPSKKREYKHWAGQK